MAADHTDEPKCTQKGTGWVSFEASQNPRKRKLVKKGGFTEWREVVCNYQVTAELNRQIQRALKARG